MVVVVVVEVVFGWLAVGRSAVVLRWCSQAQLLGGGVGGFVGIVLWNLWCVCGLGCGFWGGVWHPFLGLPGFVSGGGHLGGTL